MHVLSARLDGEPIILHESQWDSQEPMLRIASKGGRLVAPCCGARLVLKWGLRKVRHFAHAPRTECPYERWSEPESPEHVVGKVLLFEWCRRVFGTTARVVAMEYPLPETLQRPDVYVELADGTRFALEYQRSAISPGDWEERHQAYQQLGIHDIWVFGENRLADALPTEEQQARWSAKEPYMSFLKLRAFESAAAVRTPYEVAWWRGDHQEELWESLEIDARVGREIIPWYRRSALQRLRSISFLHAGSGELRIYRAMRELPGHTETRMASVMLTTSLEEPGLALEPTGFSLPQDRQRLMQHEQRVSRVESTAAQTLVVQESTVAYASDPPESRPLPAHLPAYFHEVAQRRANRSWPPAVNAQLFQMGAQEEEQRQRLATRAKHPQWRKIVDRYGLTPDNLHFLVGVPLVDDTSIVVHRTVWQAYIYYRLVWEQRRSLATREVVRLIERTFGLDMEMTRQARYWLPGEVNSPDEVVGRFLLLLSDAGYLRSDRRSEHLRFYSLENPPPPLAFQDRSQRWTAWAGLLKQELHRKGHELTGEGGPVRLVPAVMTDHPTPAQVEAVARLAQRRGFAVDWESLTYTEASQILAEARRRDRAGKTSPN